MRALFFARKVEKVFLEAGEVDGEIHAKDGEYTIYGDAGKDLSINIRKY